PSTLLKLRNADNDPIAGQLLELKLPPLPVEQILERRRAKARERATHPGQVTPLTAEFVSYLDEIENVARPALIPWIARLTNDDMRRKLDIWFNLLRGEQAYNLWWRSVHNPRPGRQFEYELLDAMLCGGHEAFKPEAIRVANVFRLGHAAKAPRDMLV